MTYQDFAAQCHQELHTLQDEMHSRYNINDYANWYYDQHTGLFTFSTGEEELNFRYAEVGSLSEKSNTWMWAWHNESVLAKARKPSEIIKKYGETHGFEKLTTSVFEADEYDAWEFAGIALKLLGGIGVYRPFSDNVKSFVILLEVVPNEEAQTIKDKYVDCNEHGSGRMAFVCQHLLSKNKVGFHELFETIEDMELAQDDDFQAWCDACEEVWQQHGEWNDAAMAFANTKIVCETCYFNIKECNLGYR